MAPAPSLWVWRSLPGEVRGACWVMVCWEGYPALRQGWGLPAPLPPSYDLVTGDFSLRSLRSFLPGQTSTIRILADRYHNPSVRTTEQLYLCQVTSS